jgi:hypothetical protein
MCRRYRLPREKEILAKNTESFREAREEKPSQDNDLIAGKARP